MSVGLRQLLPTPADPRGVMCLEIDYRHAIETARMADTRDGTSNTTLVSEDAGRPERWQMGKFIPGAYSPGGAWASGANLINIRGFNTNAGTRPGTCAINCINQSEIYSFHPSGANIVFADGSVHFLHV